jgi:hypothetical protein
MPALMSAPEFKAKSSKFMARRKNPLILDIDKLLALYPQSAGNPRRQLKIAILLYIWAKQYLAGGGTRKGVSELLGQVQAILDDPANANWMTLSHQGAQWKNGQQQSPPGNTGKAMGQGYKMEPMLPGKGSVGGVQLDAQLKRINTPALRALFEDKITAKLDANGTQYTMKGVIKMAEEAMASASIREFLDVYFEFTQSEAFAQREDFEYCDKTSREQYRVYINHADGRFYTDAAFLTAYTTDVTALPKDNWALYAFDLKGRLYCKPASQVPDGGFNHSSFTSGKPVLCAGAIEVDPGGNLRSISNESGHYRPTPGDLGNLLAMLHDEYGVDLTNVDAVVSGGTKVTLNGVAAMGIYRNYPTSNLNDF